jgi:hypothetical protein
VLASQTQQQPGVRARASPDSASEPTGCAVEAREAIVLALGAAEVLEEIMLLAMVVFLLPRLPP